VLDENKKIRILSTSKVPLKDAAGKIVGLVGIGRDITQRKEAEEVLKRDNEMLESIVRERTKKLLEVQEEFNRAKRLSDIGTLAASVAHELRNPLGIIQLAIHQLKKDRKLAENKYVADIEKKLAESDAIIDNLLGYSRIKAPAYEQVDVLELLQECISGFQAMFKDHDISIQKKYDADLRLIEADVQQLRGIFSNILNNAGQAFSRKKGRIEICVCRKGHLASIAFKDNGVGIAPEDMGKIFTPFFTRKAKGTGLGLAICNELVALHRGRIEVQSCKGEGTTFEILLPVQKPS
jgi:signal transduction histidine kinase